LVEAERILKKKDEDKIRAEEDMAKHEDEQRMEAEEGRERK
jgi:hypothetical protein